MRFDCGYLYNMYNRYIIIFRCVRWYTTRFIAVLLTSKLLGIAGGMGKVIKKVLKTKVTETTVQGDRIVFEESFVNAVAIHGRDNVDLDREFGRMPLEKLRELYTYLKHDKTVAAKKAEKLCEYFTEFESLEKTQHKLNSAIGRFREMTLGALEGEDGAIDIKNLIERVSNRVAVREAMRMDD